MARPQQHISNSKGKSLFQSLLPPAWVVDEPNNDNDYGRDFLIRVFNGGQETELLFYVQLKSHQKIKHSKGYLSESLRVSNLSDYKRNDSLPVFLVVADLGTEECYFNWIQGKGIDSRNATRRGKKTQTIRVSLKDRVSDSTRFLTAITRAYDSMQSLESVLQRRNELIEMLDARLVVEEATIGGRSFQLIRARDPLDLYLSFSDDSETTAKLQKFEELAVPVTFEEHQFSIEGSLAFQRFFSERITLTTANRLDATCNLAVYSVQGELVASFPFNRGSVEAGTKEMRFEGTTEEGCYKLHMRFDLANGAPTGKSNVSIETNLVEWKGRSVASLPYADQFARFMETFAESNALGFEILQSGNRFFSGKGTGTSVPLFAKNFASIYQPYRMLREISQATGVHFPFGDRLSAPDRRQISFLHWVVCDGTEQSAEGQSLTYRQTVRSLKESEVNGLFTMLESGGLLVRYCKPSFRILDTEVPLTHFFVRLSGMTLDRPIGEYLDFASDIDDEHTIQVRFVGKRGATKRIAPDAQFD